MRLWANSDAGYSVDASFTWTMVEQRMVLQKESLVIFAIVRDEKF